MTGGFPLLKTQNMVSEVLCITDINATFCVDLQCFPNLLFADGVISSIVSLPVIDSFLLAQ